MGGAKIRVVRLNGMTRFAPLALPLLFALAACGGNRGGNVSIDNDAASPTSTEIIPPDESTAADPNALNAENAATNAEDGPVMNSIHPIPGTPAPGAPGGPKIPAAFHGRWGMVPGDCTSTRGDAKGLISVADITVRFYESTATLAKVTGDYPENFSGLYNFTGEGQTWQKAMTLKLIGSSNTLIRSDKDGRFTYKRCA